jgi:hypothetical protein
MSQGGGVSFGVGVAGMAWCDAVQRRGGEHCVPRWCDEGVWAVCGGTRRTRRGLRGL